MGKQENPWEMIGRGRASRASTGSRASSRSRYSSQAFDAEVQQINAHPQRPPTGTSTVHAPSTSASNYSAYDMPPPSEVGWDTPVPESQIGRNTRLDLRRDRYFARQNIIRQKQHIDQLEKLVQAHNQKENDMRSAEIARSQVPRGGKSQQAERLIRQGPMDPRVWHSRRQGYGKNVVIPFLRGGGNRDGWLRQNVSHERRMQQRAPGAFAKLGFQRIKAIRHQSRFRGNQRMRNRRTPWA